MNLETTPRGSSAIAAGAEPLVARHLEFSEGKRHPAGEPVGANAV